LFRFFTLTLFAFFALYGISYGAEDILSIDKTLIIQLVIFVSAIFVLNNLLFKPLLNLQSKREQLTTGTSSEAKELKLKAEETINEYNNKINEARIQVQEERNNIRKQAQTSASEIIEISRNESQHVLEDAKARIYEDTENIKEQIKPEIETIAKDVAARLLKREILD